MHLSFNHLASVASETSFLFKKEHLLSSLTLQHKKILVVVSTALSLLAACYFLINHIYCKAKPLNNKFLDISDAVIENLPKDLLEKISSKISQQHKDLFNGSFEDGQTKKSSETIIIEDVLDTPISIVVDMKTVKGKGPPPGATFCGGNLYGHTAKIVISPENEQVIQAVAAHFKSQIIPAMMSAPTMPLFNEVEINGKKLKM
jgi:hypothetical protein